MTHNDVSIANNIHVGIAGWSYPDWEGYVYPRGTKDKLRYVAEYYDVIEINSTFYRPPEPQIATSWLNRTEDLEGFYFTAKIHQDVTHRGRIDKSVTDAFATAFEPMAEAGRLRHLLAQFRYDFADATDSRTHLSCIRDAFGHVANITLELRHSSWQSRLPAGTRFFQSANLRCWRACLLPAARAQRKSMVQQDGQRRNVQLSLRQA